MKVRVSDISDRGLPIQESLSVQALNARMAESPNNDIVFLADPKVDITVHRQESGAEVRGSVQARYRQMCGRCVKDVERELSLPLALILKAKPSKDLKRRGDQELPFDPKADYTDDLGIMYFEGEHVELEAFIQEALILALDPFWIPELDSAGRCSACGVVPEVSKFNAAEQSKDQSKKVGVSLAALLSKAGVK